MVQPLWRQSGSVYYNCKYRAIPILGIHSRQTVSSSKPFRVNFEYPTYGDQSQNQQMF